MKTVKVRIAVGVDATGEWASSGYSGQEAEREFESIIDFLNPGEARYFVTAELPIPEVTEVSGTIEE